MARVPVRSGLLADVSNNERTHEVMKSFLVLNDENAVPTSENTAFSPRTEVANKLSNIS